MAATDPTSVLVDDKSLGSPGDLQVAGFMRDGFLGPLPIFTRAECLGIAAYLRREEHPAPPDWSKGRAVHERFLYDLAIHPALLSSLTALLGDDVVLWGASAVIRDPGDVHAWHCDIESAHPDGRFVTAWIGLEHVSRESALQMISRSHLLGKTVQEARMERGLRRELATPEELLEAVREHEPLAELVQPEMTNGEVLLFDGRLWHGSNNSRSTGQRLALLLQYAAADCPVLMPDLTHLEWPFHFLPAPRPPVILVSGSDGGRANRLVPAPPPGSRGQSLVATAVHQFDLPLESHAEAWRAFPAFNGPTRTLADVSCHASVLSGGHSPHPPHAHGEEELLIPLRGDVELLIANGPSDPAPQVERLSPGSLVYYPAGQHHTIRNPGVSPVQYLMFKWDSPRSEVAVPQGTRVFHYGELAPPAGAADFWTRTIFEGPTSCLGKLHAHLTVMQPGGGYEPHVDAYDVAIVLLSGTVETLGQTVEPLSVVYYGAGEPHGLWNTGAQPATYLVFEFHAPGFEAIRPPVQPRRTVSDRAIRLAKRLTWPIRRRLKPVAGRLRRH